MTVWTFPDGAVVGQCEICGEQVYPNKPPQDRKVEDFKRYVEHKFDRHPFESFFGRSAS